MFSHEDHFYKTFTNYLRIPDKKFTNRRYIEGNMKTDSGYNFFINHPKGDGLNDEKDKVEIKILFIGKCHDRAVFGAAACGTFLQPCRCCPVVDTGQIVCYDDSDIISCPDFGESFYGQDARYNGNQPSYTDNGDRTVTDNVTGLMWQQSPDTDEDGDIDAADKLTYDEAVAGAIAQTTGGYSDWRLPNAKELQSIVDYSRSPDTTGSAAIDPLFNVTGITNEAGEADYPFYWTGTTHANDIDAYTKELSRYIHLNPVRAKMVELPDDYEWSSYNKGENRWENAETYRGHRDPIESVNNEGLALLFFCYTGGASL